MQAEAIHEAPARAAHPWLVLPWWTLATTVAGVLCLPVAEAMGLPVVWGMKQTTAGGLPEAIATGAIIGFAQWLVLRAYVRGKALWLWPVATALGLVLGIITLGALRGTLNSLNLHIVLGFAIDGAIEVGGVGLCQWLVLALMLNVRGAAWWLPATILAGAAWWPVRNGLSLVLGKTFNIISDSQAFISAAAAFLLYGVITGLTLVLLLRKPSVSLKIEDK